MLSSEPSLEKRLALRLSLAVGIVVALAIAAVAYVGADIAGDIARNAAYDSTAARILGIYRRIEWIIYTMVAALAFSFVGIVRASRRAARSVVDALENHAALLHNLGSRNLRAVEGLEAMRSRGVYDHAACETAIAHLASISEVARENADITRNYSRDYHPETREVDLAAVVSDVVDTEGDIARAGGVSLRWSPPKERVVVRGVESDLDSVVRNLVSNAVKYTKEGGKVDISLVRIRRGVALTVADTGIGMTKEAMSRMYDRGFRADWRGPVPGNGLGLSLVRSIVAPCGGRIRATSSPGKGTTFNVTLPLDMTRRPSLFARMRRLF